MAETQGQAAGDSHKKGDKPCAISIDDIPERIPRLSDSDLNEVTGGEFTKTVVKGLKTKCNLGAITKDAEELDQAIMGSLNTVVLGDHRWREGTTYLRGLENWNRDMAAKIIRQGALKFGIYHLTRSCMEGLVDQLMGSATRPSPTMRRWVADHCDNVDLTPEKVKALGNLQGRIQAKASMADMDVRNDFKQLNAEAAKWRLFGVDWKGIIGHADQVKIFKWCLSGVIFMMSNFYAIKVVANMYPDVIELFGWPVYLARMGGMGTALWTAVLYLTMSRTFISWLTHRLPQTGIVLAFFDAHKDLHILAGQAMCVTAAEHILAHSIGTVPGLLKATVAQVNSLLGCANKDTTPGFFAVDLSAIEWPECPVTEIPKDFTAVVFTTMPGVTGVLLVVLLSGVAYTARQQGRKTNFDAFIYLHNVLVILWPILLFFHGSQGWIGVGFPLVVFTSSLPIAAYMTDRLLRALRYFLYAGKQVRIVSCTVRPGKDEGPEGALINLQINPPPHLWNFRQGMYAFLCMPEYAALQWHPFTICSGGEDPTVDFLIAGIGDWTRHLAQRCLAARNEGKPLPKVGIDGPYAAPTQSAMSMKLLIAVGAGVGITPFLSLLATIIKRADASKLKEAHFFWLSRGVDEFLFGRRLFSKIVSHPRLQDTVFLHLHCSATVDKEGKGDATAFLFREALKKQSAVDKTAFAQVWKNAGEKNNVHLLTGPQLPWTWVSGGKQDVLWLSHLVKSEMCDYELEIGASYGDQSHWAAQLFTTENMKTLPLAIGHHQHGGEKRDEPVRDAIEESVEEEQTRWEKSGGGKEARYMLPVVFGRPDWATQVRSIGKSRPDTDVDIYICGNDMIVQSLQEVAVVCNNDAEESAGRNVEPGNSRKTQRYTVHYERFG